MHCQVIKELFCFEHGMFHAFAANCAYCNEDCEVDSVGVVKDAPNHLPDMLDILVGQRGRLVWGEGALGLTAILF